MFIIKLYHLDCNLAVTLLLGGSKLLLFLCLKHLMWKDLI